MRPLLELHAGGCQLRHLAECLHALQRCADGDEDFSAGSHINSVPHPFAVIWRMGGKLRTSIYIRAFLPFSARLDSWSPTLFTKNVKRMGHGTSLHYQ